jgi:hypothetical protein
MTQNIEELYKERVSEKVVAGVLELICSVPFRISAISLILETSKADSTFGLTGEHVS